MFQKFKVGVICALAISMLTLTACEDPAQRAAQQAAQKQQDAVAFMQQCKTELSSEECQRISENLSQQDMAKYRHEASNGLSFGETMAAAAIGGLAGNMIGNALSSRHGSGYYEQRRSYYDNERHYGRSYSAPRVTNNYYNTQAPATRSTYSNTQQTRPAYSNSTTTSTTVREVTNRPNSTATTNSNVTTTVTPAKKSFFGSTGIRDSQPSAPAKITSRGSSTTTISRPSYRSSSRR